MPAMLRLFAATALSAVGALAIAAPARADAIEDFYRGKQMDMIIGYSSGGTYDLYARLVARFLGDHIPGKPRVIPRNMPGAGSRLAAGWIYNIGPKDGTVIGTGDQSLAVEQAMGDKALTIDVSKLQYIGNPAADNNTTGAWHTSGIKTLEDAKRQEVPTGATGGSTSSQYPKAMNALLGTKFKIITGYPGGNEINLALEKGEVAVRGSNAWGSWKATRPDWLRDKKINILVQIGLEKAPDLPDVPLIMDFAKTELDRKALELLFAPQVMAWPLVAPPDVPADRVATLRKAFAATMKDTDFLADAKKLNIDVEPVPGELMQTLVARVSDFERAVVDRALELTEVK